jgi:CRISPR-associated protein Cst2
MDCFKRMGEGVGCPKLLRLVEVRDVLAGELIVGGEIADTLYGKQMQEMGVKVHRGVKEAIAAAKLLLNTEVSA